MDNGVFGDNFYRSYAKALDFANQIFLLSNVEHFSNRVVGAYYTEDMLFSIDYPQNAITHVPHATQFEVWRGRLSDAQYQAIVQTLNSMIDGDEVQHFELDTRS